MATRIKSKKPQSAEMQPGPGFRVKAHMERMPTWLIDRFREFGTPDISDMQNRLYTMSAEIHNVINAQTISGTACTVKVFPGDNLMVHKALDIARPGDIVVVDAGGYKGNAVFGDFVAMKAKHRGIAGFVIDGLTRDIAALKEVGLPVFAKGVSPIGPLHRGPGEINYAVSCGGIVVNPGDLIIGDADGVVVVRQEFAEDILARLDEQKAALAAYAASIRRGEFSNEWVDRLLDSVECPYFK